MTDSLRPRILRAGQVESQDWLLPDMTEAQEAPSDNALHRLSRPPAEVEEEETLPPPPTLEEIERIREEAYEDGFAEGKAAGEAKGLEEGRLKGAEQGHAEGYQQGLEQGLEAGKAEIATRTAQWDQLLGELIAPLEAADEQVERELVTLAMRLAQAVVQVELTTSPDAVLEALRQGIHALPSQRQKVAIHASESDRQLIADTFGEDALSQRQWELVLEPTLSPGSLVLNTERSEVPMLGDDRLRKVLETFAQRPRDPVDEPAYPRPAPQAEASDPAPEQPEPTESSVPAESEASDDAAQ
ncbi:flagellar assembly protein FliH [Marinobacter hydrocarbonoclasticus]|nr:flagellar assembly protein FliH [Marinobacter nauticus]